MMGELTMEAPEQVGGDLVVGQVRTAPRCYGKDTVQFS